MTFKMLKLFLYVFLFCGVTANFTRRYVTYKDLFNKSLIDTSPSLPLERFKEKYYYFGAIYEGSYYQAIQFCNYHQMSLLSIESKEENDFLYERLKNFLGVREYHFWTSGTTLTGHDWIWLTSGKPILYANWFPNQPDNAGNNEHCLEIRHMFRSDSLRWNDHVCTVAKNVICEIGLTKSLSNLVNGVANCNLTLINVPAE